MTDGTTATQVSPVKEEDMAKVREVFQRALDAIIAATELSKTVAAMKIDVDRLRKDIEDTQARNVELDRMLSDTRRQRDEAEQALAQAKRDLSESQSRADATQHALTDAQHLSDDLQAKLDATRKERDDHGLEAMALREALDKANARLATIHKTMGVEFTPFDVPKPLPEPIQPTVVYNPETVPEASKAKVWSDSPSFDWNHEKTWDETSRRYWYEQ